LFNVQCTMYMSDEQEGHIAHWKIFLQKHKKFLEDAYFIYYIFVVKQLIISYDSRIYLIFSWEMN